MKKIYLLVIFIILVVLMPYVLAWANQGKEVFTGLLFNPIDGFSYLAKMRIGWDGSWKFFLPYSAKGGEGAYIFLFYIFLGHVARSLNLTLPFIFHLARIGGSIFMIWAIVRFLKIRLNFSSEQIFKTILLLCLGAGLGWIGLFFNKTSPDFWLSEAFPFLSMFANPHFPLGLGLMVLIFTEVCSSPGWKRLIFLIFLGILLSIILPFGFAIVAVVSGVLVLWKFLEKRKKDNAIIVVIFIPGGLWLIYQFAAIMADPVLSIWNSQNLTPMPGIFEILLAFSPAAFIAGAGIIILLKGNRGFGEKLLAVWVVVSIVLSILPLGLQRRFLTGIFIPISILGMMALEAMPIKLLNLKRAIFLSWLLLSIPTNMITTAIFTLAGWNHAPRAFLSKTEIEAFQWIAENLPKDALCLAGEDTGLILPAYSHCKVLYGHPFESIKADETKSDIEKIYDIKLNPYKNADFLSEKGIDYIIVDNVRGDRKPNLPVEAFDMVFKNADVEILQVKP